MIGTMEILTILGVILIIAVFGRKTFKKVLRDAFSAKKDYEDIKQEFESKTKIEEHN